MDYIEKLELKGKSFIIYGAGDWGKLCYQFLIENGGIVKVVIDNNKTNDKQDLPRIISYKEYLKKDYKEILVLAIQKSKNIWMQLEEDQLEYFCYSPAFQNLFSGQKKMTIGDEILSDVFELSKVFTGLTLKMKSALSKKINQTSSYVMAMTLRDVKIHNRFVYGVGYIRTATLEQAAKELERRKTPGAMAELGVYKGEFARVMNSLFPDKELYLFDTFEGFETEERDREIKNNYMNSKLDFKDTSVEKVLGIMQNPEKIIVKKGYFPETTFMIKKLFCLVSIDCDLYESVYAGLIWFYEKLAPGGYIFVHDCVNQEFLGSKEALIRFSEQTGVGYVIIPDSCGTAVITKSFLKV